MFAIKFGEFMKLNKINDVLSNNRVMANEIIKTSDSIEDLFSKCGLGWVGHILISAILGSSI